MRDEGLRGAVLGIDSSTRAVDLYAATLEGVALAVSHALLPSEADRTLPVVGGGARSEPWRRILADVTGRPVLALDGVDSTVLGASIAGADALGLRHDITPLAERGGEIVEPDLAAAARYADLRSAHRDLYDLAAQVGRVLELKA